MPPFLQASRIALPTVCRPSERRSRVRGVGAASRLGHSAQEHLRTHAHFVIDRSELDYADVLTNARPVQTP
jgi:hypothetical protein